jgi:hypothetical protein
MIFDGFIFYPPVRLPSALAYYFLHSIHSEDVFCCIKNYIQKSPFIPNFYIGLNISSPRETKKRTNPAQKNRA